MNRADRIARVIGPIPTVGASQPLAAPSAPQFQIEISRNRAKTWDYLTTVPNEPGGFQDFFWEVTGALAFASRFRVSAIGDPDGVDVNGKHPHRGSDCRDAAADRRDLNCCRCPADHLL